MVKGDIRFRVHTNSIRFYAYPEEMRTFHLNDFLFYGLMVILYKHACGLKRATHTEVENSTGAHDIRDWVTDANKIVLRP